MAVSVGITPTSNPPTPACGIGFTLVGIAGCAGDFGDDFVGGADFLGDLGGLGGGVTLFFRFGDFTLGTFFFSFFQLSNFTTISFIIRVCSVCVFGLTFTFNFLFTFR